MEMLSAEEVAERLDELVHRPTQEASDGVDVTIGRVFALDGDGAIDFGGSEQQDADRRELGPKKRDSDDDYGWWSLGEGVFVFAFNESLQLKPGELAVVSPLPRLTHAAGASHSTLQISGDADRDRNFQVVASVGCGSSIDIKENARSSRVRIFRS